MSKRPRLVFDSPSLPFMASPVPVRRQPEAHRCQAPGCREWASYGVREPGVVAMREPCVWFCKDHRPETVSQ